MRIEFKINGVDVPVGLELLEVVASGLRDREENAAVFRELAKSSSREVRERIANKDKIDEETALMLAEDPVEEVVADLLRNDGRKFLPQNMIEKLIQRSPRLASEIADRVSDLGEDCTPHAIAELLAGHPDPTVRKAVAGNYNVSKKLLKILVGDSDIDVACEAAEALRR